MSTNVPITVAHGDGIGPEIMEASLHIIQEAGARIDLETIEIGEKVYLRGNSSGIEPSSWESLRRTQVFYKAPITTPHTKEFAQAVVARLGKTPHTLQAAHYSSAPPKARREKARAEVKLGIDGIDVYIAWPSLETGKLGAAAQKASGEGLELTMIDNRGVKVRCRFTAQDGGTTSKKTVALLGRVLEQGLEIVKTETLRTYDGADGYTLSQGQ
jgi:isocitrate/isopropylmalate dehydrogenase